MTSQSGAISSAQPAQPPHPARFQPPKHWRIVTAAVSFLALGSFLLMQAMGAPCGASLKLAYATFAMPSGLVLSHEIKKKDADCPYVLILMSSFLMATAAGAVSWMNLHNSVATIALTTSGTAAFSLGGNLFQRWRALQVN